MSDDLAAKVAQLLGEPRPPDVRVPRKELSIGGPVGLALTVFGVAKDLVAEVNYIEAVNDWEQRQARLRELEDLLSSGVVIDAGREALRAEVETLRLRGWAVWERTAALSSAFGAVTRDVATLVKGYGQRLAVIRTAKESTVVVARAAARNVMCAEIDAETLRVLELREYTAAMQVADVYSLVVQPN